MLRAVECSPVCVLLATEGGCCSVIMVDLSGSMGRELNSRLFWSTAAGVGQVALPGGNLAAGS
jgi:hypothetical protein